jgi:hypothetical protein
MAHNVEPSQALLDAMGEITHRSELRARIKDALKNAVDNGYTFWGWSIPQIAIDMEDCGVFSDYPDAPRALIVDILRELGAVNLK